MKWLLVAVLLVADTGIVQEGRDEGKHWILWVDTETGRQSLEVDPAIYRMPKQREVRTWKP